MWHHCVDTFSRVGRKTIYLVTINWFLLSCMDKIVDVCVSLLKSLSLNRSNHFCSHFNPFRKALFSVSRSPFDHCKLTMNFHNISRTFGIAMDQKNEQQCQTERTNEQQKKNAEMLLFPVSGRNRPTYPNIEYNDNNFSDDEKRWQWTLYESCVYKHNTSSIPSMLWMCAYTILSLRCSIPLLVSITFYLLLLIFQFIFTFSVLHYNDMIFDIQIFFFRHSDIKTRRYTHTDTRPKVRCKAEDTRRVKNRHMEPFKRMKLTLLEKW